MEHPEQFAWQIFDQKVTHLLRDEYRIREATEVQANSIEELAFKLDGVDPQAFINEVAAYNNAVATEVPFDPTLKDGRCLVGTDVPKSNWANSARRRSVPGLSGDVWRHVHVRWPASHLRGQPGHRQPGSADQGAVRRGRDHGGLFFRNYPGGTGLTAGSVFGRRAGYAAASTVKLKGSSLS